MKIIKHGFEAVYNKDSKILILGSFPSIKSRENQFFYGHPQNRFWKLMARILEEENPNSITDKKKLVLNNNIALYDAVEEAEIEGSMDADLKVIKPSNLSPILENTRIQKIFCNGTKSYEIVTKEMKLNAIKLPSTSAANARYNMDRLYEKWKIILKYLD